jgi:branched-chain amino acid aminotransferase
VLVFLNGRFVPEAEARVSVFDRGFLYGDGLFETIRVYGGHAFRWNQHLDRLQRGAASLCLRLPFSPERLEAHAQGLIQRNALPDSVLRISLTRGVGPRGYSLQSANQPVLVMTLHPAPAPDPAGPPHWRLVTSTGRVAADDPLAGLKTANKLRQILARAEAEARGADEALLLNQHGHVAEAAAGNVFWIEAGTVCTPPLSSGPLPGVTRGVVLELCRTIAVPSLEREVRPDRLKGADGVFLTLSTLGIVEAISLDGVLVKQSPIVAQLRRAYRELVASEVAEGGRATRSA